jgi:transcriptional regulator with XRE-family HTH domain
MAEFRVLRSYRFVDKDPVCDELRTLVEDRGLMSQLKRVAELSGLAPSTVNNLFNGETKKPQNRTVMGVASSIGYRREWVSLDFDLEKELKAARAYNEKEKARVAALRAKEIKKTRKRK